MDEIEGTGDLDLIINGLIAGALRIVEAVPPSDRGGFLVSLEHALVAEIDRVVNRLYVDSLREVAIELLYRTVTAKALELLHPEFPSQPGPQDPPQTS